MGKELPDKYYDKVYRKSKEYRKKAEDVIYYELWMNGIAHVKKIKPDIIIDLGCGPGHFEELLEKHCEFKKCVGYDFSSFALGMAKDKIVSNNINFEQADLVNDVIDFKNKHEGNKIMFVSYEFLEHVEADLKILNNICVGSYISFSVPSYNSKGHVRFFKNREEVLERYSKIIKFIDTKELRYEDNKIIFICLGIKI